MDRIALGLKLREFYLLEYHQVRLFGDQIPSLDDKHVIKVYQHMVGVEQTHVDEFAALLREGGFNLPEVVVDFAGFAGLVAAKSLDLFTRVERYKLGVAVEKKASEMYGQFIEMVGDEDKRLSEILWHNRIDEEFHRCWFAAELEALTRVPSSV